MGVLGADCKLPCLLGNFIFPLATSNRGVELEGEIIRGESGGVNGELMMEEMSMRNGKRERMGELYGYIFIYMLFMMYYVKNKNVGSYI